GSLLVSVTVVLIGMGIIFFRVGLQSEGRFVRAAGWFVLLAVWCELLVIGGILLTERLHLHSFFTGPFQSVQRKFSTATAHAIGHAEGFWFRTPFLVGIGGIIYSVAKRKRV